MEWNCIKCNREIISKERKEFCLECWWKDLVEKTEINPETVRTFMEKYWLTILDFRKNSYYDVLFIGSEDTKTLLSRKQREHLETSYSPRTKKNMNKMGGIYETAFLSEYTAFLEKLFHFSQKEKIKVIRSNSKAEKNANNETLFKVDSIIIEKKTNEELEKEE